MVFNQIFVLTLAWLANQQQPITSGSDICQRWLAMRRLLLYTLSEIKGPLFHKNAFFYCILAGIESLTGKATKGTLANSGLIEKIWLLPKDEYKHLLFNGFLFLTCCKMCVCMHVFDFVLTAILFFWNELDHIAGVDKTHQLERRRARETEGLVFRLDR